MNRQGILFTGGGTGGSVTPMLAVAEHILSHRGDIDVTFAGTKNGPEGELIKSAGFKFITFPAGKYRRYASWANVIDILKLLGACYFAWKYLRRLRPAVIVSAGSYVSVPFVWVGWALGISSLIHQQDVHPGLANRLMAPCAKRITLTFEQTLSFFPGKKSVVTGNPIRPELRTGDIERARQAFQLDPALPTVLILGGGTGALSINQLIVQSAFRFLERANVIHITGHGKAMASLRHNHYHPVEFLTDLLADVYAAADLVVSRAGLGTLTELSALKKPAIIIPLPDTHQEQNAALFESAKAVIALNERNINAEGLATVIVAVLNDPARRLELSELIGRLARPDALERLSQEVIRFLPHA